MEARAQDRGPAGGRLPFVDNLRSTLTVQVLLLHLMITYSGTGSWYYFDFQGRPDEATFFIGGWFCVANQAYFMGLFYLISAYFVPTSYDRKGACRFLKDRLVRLGIPLVVYGAVMEPLLLYGRERFFHRTNASLLEFWGGRFGREAFLGAGPLWFVETLLIFSGAYVLWRLLRGERAAPIDTRAVTLPSSVAIVAFAALLGAGAFLVRLAWPVGWAFGPLNLQLPFFVQYIALFTAGIAASRRRWFVVWPSGSGRRWLVAGIAGILLVPALFLAGGALADAGPFLGGFHWQSLAYALLESHIGISMCIGVMVLFRDRFNRAGRFARAAAATAYGAFIVQGPVLVFVALAFRGLALYPLLKFVLVASVAVPACFAASALLRLLPGARRVL